jgi:hypothetical protein
LGKKEEKMSCVKNCKQKHKIAAVCYAGSLNPLGAALLAQKCAKEFAERKACIDKCNSPAPDYNTSTYKDTAKSETASGNTWKWIAGGLVLVALIIIGITIFSKKK